MAAKNDLDQALERYHRAALRAKDRAYSEGTSTERTRVRLELLAWLKQRSEKAKTFQDYTAKVTELHLIDSLRLVLDRICPE